MRGGYGGDGIPLGERIRRTPHPGPAEVTPDSAEMADSQAPVPDGGEVCPARHCWIALPADGPEPRPGVLWEWRKVERGRFEGLVSYPAALRTGRWAMVTEWVPSELLAPLSPTPPRRPPVAPR